MNRKDTRWNWEKRLQRWLARLFGIREQWAQYELAKYGTNEHDDFSRDIAWLDAMDKRRRKADEDVAKRMRELGLED